MGEMISETLVGLLLIFFGYRITQKENPGSIWKGRYPCFWEELQAAYKELGFNGIVMGSGCAAIPAINWLSKSNFGYWFGFFTMGIGFLRGILVLLKYRKYVRSQI
jgi:hypothetical protein